MNILVAYFLADGSHTWDLCSCVLDLLHADDLEVRETTAAVVDDFVPGRSKDGLLKSLSFI